MTSQAKYLRIIQATAFLQADLKSLIISCVDCQFSSAQPVLETSLQQAFLSSMTDDHVAITNWKLAMFTTLFCELCKIFTECVF